MVRTPLSTASATPALESSEVEVRVAFMDRSSVANVRPHRLRDCGPQTRHLDVSAESACRPLLGCLLSMADPQNPAVTLRDLRDCYSAFGRPVQPARMKRTLNYPNIVRGQVCRIWLLPRNFLLAINWFPNRNRNLNSRFGVGNKSR